MNESTTAKPKPPSELTRDEIEAWARQQDRTKRNPMLPINGTPMCAYTGEDGSHCIAGQFFTDHGYELPNEGDPAVSARGFNNTRAGRILGTLQNKADWATKTGHLTPWGYAIEAVFGTDQA